MAKLKLTVAKLEDVEEAHRSLYVETKREGKTIFELDADGLSDIRAALRAANTEAATLRTRFKDIDPETVAQQTEELAQLRQKAGPEAIKAIEEQIRKTEGRERTKLEERLRRMESSLYENLVDAEATKAIAAAKGSVGLLLPHVRSLVTVVEKDGKYVPQVVGSGKQPRVRDDGAPFTITDLVEEMRGQEQFGRAFDAPGGGGSGSEHHSGGGGAAGLKRSKMSVSDKAAFVDKHGQEAYFKLPW